MPTLHPSIHATESAGRDAVLDEELQRLCRSTDIDLRRRYRSLREVLELTLRRHTAGSGLQATDLAARINYAAALYALPPSVAGGLHTFRLTSNAVLNHRCEPSEEAFARDVAAVSEGLRRMQTAPATQTAPPPAAEAPRRPPASDRRFVKRMRVCFHHAEGNDLLVRPTEGPCGELLRVALGRPGVNDAFQATASCLWPHAQLNLLDVTVEDDGRHVPALVVLEPDYLIDISTLAECHREYGAHPANYLLGKFAAPGNTRALLLGNIANLFLDEWIYAPAGCEPRFADCMRKAFRRYPLELAACEDLHDAVREKEFARDCRLHFEHIRHTVLHTFGEPGYRLNRDDAVLEPSFICEALGIQGRLDYMQRDMRSFIEMKSGKADEYALRGKIVPRQNNRVQMLLYMAMLEYSMGQEHRLMRPYLFYTRYPLLYPASPSRAQVKRTIDLRNRIVAAEHAVQLHNRPDYTRRLLERITPEALNEQHLRGPFWENWLKPSIASFGTRFRALDSVEQEYFLTLYNFIAKEQYTARSGDTPGQQTTLWRATLDEKKAAGEILCDLRLTRNAAAQPDKPAVELALPPDDDTDLPNFRNGDAVLLYERNSEADNVTGRMVFKAVIDRLTGESLTLRLRDAQRNPHLFPPDGRYAIEHDSMDTGFRAMYRGLAAFMEADPARRDLLLGRREPRFDTALDERIARAGDDFERVALKALAARDYFLLVGPPGTGKTSRALRRMVELFHAQPSAHILLLAYTNRAVDEICRAVASIGPAIDFLRIGGELSCDVRYRPRLLENALAACADRRAVNALIAGCRVFTGTVSAVSARPELFRLKHFDAVIVDEASQILEPQLLGVLCARGADGRNGADRFILIGDHKQLPAVVMQERAMARVEDGPLSRQSGLRNVCDALFERLYRRLGGHSLAARATDMLCRQGRMHPGVARFPSDAFYNSLLQPVGLPHQCETVAEPVVFVPAARDDTSASGKTNRHEARIAARRALEVYSAAPAAFDPQQTLGIITPYRSQIALIRKELAATGIEALMQVTVDTVERYQGSERDVIVYSFCVNRPYQLDLLPCLTEEDGVTIDRKLNVALTRARRRLILTGVEELLRRNALYARLIDAAVRTAP